jgi:NRAMP (natural resistance-associated macrophage protein)-like metal ion transporter
MNTSDQGQHRESQDESNNGIPTNPHSEPATGSGSLEAAMEREPSAIKRFFMVLGPGLITGAADDDPSGIGTYATAGAAYGFATLWTSPLTLPMMAAVQFICAKIGMVAGMGLSGVLKRNYSKWVLIPAITVLVVANTINAGTDIGAIAAAINIFLPIPITVLIIPVAMIILALQVWGSYRLIARVFRWLTLALFAYIGSALFSRPDILAVLKATFIPAIRLDQGYLMTIVAILGTTISPYLFFWQASEEVEEEVEMGRTELSQREGATQAELRYAALDVDIGMIVCNVVFFFVILAAASTLHTSGKTHIESATDVAQALRPLAGDAASLLFAIGLIGSGMLAVPVLTGTNGYAICEAFGWKYGLDTKPKEARHFYIIIGASTLVGVLINYLGVNPMTALFWTAVLNGLLAPPLLLLIMIVSNNRKVMGQHTNGRLINIVGWITTLLMFAAAIGMFVV